MRRRAVVVAVGGTVGGVIGALLALPTAAQAQPAPKLWRIGILETLPEADNAANLAALRLGLRERGHIEGQHLEPTLYPAQDILEPLRIGFVRLQRVERRQDAVEDQDGKPRPLAGRGQAMGYCADHAGACFASASVSPLPLRGSPDPKAPVGSFSHARSLSQRRVATNMTMML